MNIFVGCSSRTTENENYNRIAEEIGNFIVKKGYNFVFGGCDVDYRDIEIKDEIGYISVKAIFGGATIYVSKDVKVEVQGTPIAGGVENKTKSNPDAKKTLLIDYTLIFGGIEIKN